MQSRLLRCLLATLAFTASSFGPAAGADARFQRFGARALAPGDGGRDVRVLQRWLTRVGHRTRVDGEFGRRTARSVRGYERGLRLRVDGRVSRAQAKGLRQRVMAVSAPPPVPAVGPAVLAPDGRTAIAPASAPAPVQLAIAAANSLTDKPYRYGGGHGSFEDSAYDCSGAVSYVLHAAGLLASTLDSTGLMAFGERGAGSAITVLAHGDHAYIVIAGLRFDTSGAGEEGPRWRTARGSRRGYEVRHPPGL